MTEQPTEAPAVDLLSQIVAFERGDLTEQQQLELFALLVKTGFAWKLQGSYGRAASQLIEDGYLDDEGNILRDTEDDE